MVNLVCHEIWANEYSLWSAWVKPVLFAAMPDAATSAMESRAPGPSGAPAEPHVLDVPGLPSAAGHDALVLDLPGAESVELGVALAGRGFRPVPLFNGTSGPSPVVNVQPVVDALLAGSAALRSLSLRADAPPAFLLDARRDGAGAMVSPGRYDNRWIVLPQDMPSGNFLRGQGIERVTLVGRGRLHPAQDLAHVLFRWQEQGVEMRIVDLDTRRVAERVQVVRPARFGSVFYSALALLGLRRNTMGGFGSLIPEDAARSGWYG